MCRQMEGAVGEILLESTVLSRGALPCNVSSLHSKSPTIYSHVRISRSKQQGIAGRASVWSCSTRIPEGKAMSLGRKRRQLIFNRTTTTQYRCVWTQYVSENTARPLVEYTMHCLPPGVSPLYDVAVAHHGHRIAVVQHRRQAVSNREDGRLSKRGRHGCVHKLRGACIHLETATAYAVHHVAGRLYLKPKPFGRLARCSTAYIPPSVSLFKDFRAGTLLANEQHAWEFRGNPDPWVSRENFGFNSKKEALCRQSHWYSLSARR